MRKDLLEILVCPTDKGGLESAVSHEDGTDIVSGTLTCALCGVVYEIADGVPNLLPIEIRQ
ncbi:MAG: putative conserved protein YbaR, Trm112 family [Chloroflexi bacterium]|jgi:uncharacterized protein YbaR (Trm112 family)|nr:MAG: putative conserved protein YbaR, Trm112 family [Chloroflexota bacterium]